MREVLFRAKKIVCGNRISEWEYGVPLMSNPNSELAYIKQLNSYEYQVDTETIGQYTGLKDKNGTKIFDGDIVKVYLAYKTIVCIVKWEDCGYVLQDIKIQDYKYSMGKSFELEVIGNIHDNPELFLRQSECTT